MGDSREKGIKNPGECLRGGENPLGLEVTDLRLLLVLLLGIKSLPSAPHLVSL